MVFTRHRTTPGTTPYRGGPLAVLAALALLLVAAPALAQGTATPGVSADEIEQSTLESFAAAAIEVETISRTWSERMAGVEDDAELQSMRQEAQSEMVEAVRDEGISVEEYNMVLQVAQADPDLNARLQELMREEAGQ